MALYYFFDRAGGVGLLASAGLADRLPAPALTLVDGATGPEGLAGTVFHDGRAPVLPQGICWQRAVDGDYWLGWHPARRPGPAELARGLDVGGFAIKLCDGHEWIVPLVLECTALDPGRRSGLPTEPRNIDGAAGWAPKAEYDELRFEAFRLAEQLLEGGRFTMDVLPYVARVLGVAYRVGIPEIVALRLLDIETARSVVLASIDWGQRVIAKAAEMGIGVLDYIGPAAPAEARS